MTTFGIKVSTDLPFPPNSTKTKGASVIGRPMCKELEDYCEATIEDFYTKRMIGMFFQQKFVQLEDADIEETEDDII